LIYTKWHNAILKVNMARLPRLAIPDQMHYVCQMGHNGGQVLTDITDAQAFLASLRYAASNHPVRLHAYMLLPDRYGLLMTPQSNSALSDFVQGLGRKYARYFNRRHLRSGTLWNGRFQATLLEAATYHNDVMIWMAGQSVIATEAMGWPLQMVSSVPHYSGNHQEVCITPHALWWELGNTPFERESTFRQRLDLGLTDARAIQLCRSLGRNWVLASQEFLTLLGRLTERRLIKGSPGRPRTRPTG
jgi:putative transposase